MRIKPAKGSSARSSQRSPAAAPADEELPLVHQPSVGLDTLLAASDLVQHHDSRAARRSSGNSNRFTRSKAAATPSGSGSAGGGIKRPRKLSEQDYDMELMNSGLDDDDDEAAAGEGADNYSDFSYEDALEESDGRPSKRRASKKGGPKPEPKKKLRYGYN